MQNVIINKKCNCRIRNIAGKTYIIPIMNRVATGENLYVINSTAQCIWEIIDNKEKICVDDLIQEFVAMVDIEKDKEDSVKEDLLIFLQFLEEIKLIELVRK